MNDELKSKISSTLLECVGINALADTLALLAQTSPSEKEKATWLEAYSILTDGEKPPELAIEAPSPATQEPI